MVDKTTNRGYKLPPTGQEEWDELLNENFETIDGDVQQAIDGSGGMMDIEGVHWVDPDTDDIGAAINAIIEDADPYDEIIIPPAEYDLGEAVELTKHMHIAGGITGAGGRRTSPARIRAIADVPFITSHEDRRLTLNGVDFHGNGYDNGYGVLVRGQSDIQDCRIRNCESGELGEGDNLLLSVRSSNDSVGSSSVRNVDLGGAERHGLVIENPANDSAPNSMDIQVNNTRGCGEYGIWLDRRSWGNRVALIHAGGMSDAEGGIYCGGNQYDLYIGYASANISPAIYFADSSRRNYAEIAHIGSGDWDEQYVDNGNNNTVKVLRDRRYVTSAEWDYEGRKNVWNHNGIVYGNNFDRLNDAESYAEHEYGMVKYPNGEFYGSSLERVSIVGLGPGRRYNAGTKLTLDDDVTHFLEPDPPSVYRDFMIDFDEDGSVSHNVIRTGSVSESLGCKFENIWFSENVEADTGIFIRDDYTTVSNCHFMQGCDLDREIRVASREKAVIEGCRGLETVDDEGHLTLVNGRGTNDGDPNTTGQWSDSDANEYAEEMGAMIVDTNTDELYVPVSGSYVNIG